MSKEYDLTAELVKNRKKLVKDGVISEKSPIQKKTATKAYDSPLAKAVRRQKHPDYYKRKDAKKIKPRSFKVKLRVHSDYKAPSSHRKKK